MYDKMRLAVPVQTIFGHPARLYQGGSLTERPDVTPFLVYRIGIQSPVRLGGGTPAELLEDPKRQFAQVWAHDEGGDYDRIDAGLEAVKAALVGSEPDSTVMECRWIETSRDLRDIDFGTITRYHRYLLTK